MTETFGELALGMVLAAFCFPFPTMVCICVFSLGRVLHQIGYSNSGYGAHAPGFMLAMVSNAAVEGLL
eukprot:1173217-Prorocentrum_minimum.AAC.1